jgi:hypothetical protein
MAGHRSVVAAARAANEAGMPLLEALGGTPEIPLFPGQYCVFRDLATNGIADPIHAFFAP